MRLWHTSLISVLPREQLVGAWRELSAIAGSIKEKGTPNHLLVDFVMDYPMNHFISYAYYVREEMSKRSYRTMESVWKKITSLVDNNDYSILPINEVYYKKMDEKYLDICFYNLYEKHLCGGISDDDFVKINETVWNVHGNYNHNIAF